MPGVTTAWHDAPDVALVPGGLVLELEQPVPAEALVAWEGAEEVARDAGASRALCRVPADGRVTVRVTVTQDLGVGAPSIALRSCTIEGASLDPAQAAVTTRAVTGGVGLDETLANEQTVALYFGPSIADVTALGDGTYATSVGRPVTLRARVEPAGLTALLEWRVDGQVVEGLGSQIVTTFDAVGVHRVSVGPPGAAASIEISTYATSLVSTWDGVGIPEGQAVTFVATTDPPGFEPLVRWLASTKVGASSPITGTGSIFTTTFTSVGGADAWLGVKADQAQAGQDGAPPAPSLPLLDQLDVLRPGDVFGRDGLLVSPVARFVARDLDGDGDRDLVWQRAHKDTVAWAFQGSNGFAMDATFEAAIPGLVTMAMLDVTGDGLDDLLTLGNQAGELGVHAASPSGGFSATPSQVFATTPRPYDMTVANVDGLGAEDVVTFAREPRELTIHTAANAYAGVSVAMLGVPRVVVPAADVGIPLPGVLVFTEDPVDVQLVLVSGGTPVVSGFGLAFPGLAGLGPVVEVLGFDQFGSGGVDDRDAVVITYDLVAGEARAHVYLRENGVSSGLVTSFDVVRGAAQYLTGDVDGDGLEDLLFARHDDPSGFPTYAMFAGDADEGLACDPQPVDDADVEDAIAEAGEVEASKELEKTIDLEGTATKVEGLTPVAQPQVFWGKLAEIIDLLDEFGDYLKADQDPANDTLGDKVKMVAADLLDKLANGRILTGCLPEGVLGAACYSADVAERIILNKDLVDAPCDWADADFVRLVATLFHEGVHAGCDAYGGEDEATGFTIALLLALLEDSVDANGDFVPGGFLGMNLPPEEHPTGSDLKDVLTAEKISEKCYRLSAHTMASLVALASELIGTWETYPPNPALPLPASGTGGQDTAFNAAKAAIVADCELTGLTHSITDVDEKNNGKIKIISVTWTISWCGEDFDVEVVDAERTCP